MNYIVAKYVLPSRVGKHAALKHLSTHRSLKAARRALKGWRKHYQAAFVFKCYKDKSSCKRVRS